MVGDGLLQAILDAPEDDAPRLVYADWLEEHGDADRAEFIRVQIQRAQFPSIDERQSELQARERRLLVSHARAWCGDWWLAYRFRRGFLESIRPASPGHFLDNADRLFAAAPVTEVWFDTQEAVWDPGETAALAASPHLRRVRRLRLPPGRSFEVPTEALLALTASPHLIGLQSLDLGHGMCYSQIDDSLLAELIGAAGRPVPPCFRTLRWLGLSDAQLGDAAVATLVAAPLAETLTHLDLSDNARISLLGVLSLVSSALWPRLTELDLTGVDRHPVVGGLVVEALGRSQLRRVGLRADPAVLAAAPSWGPVEALRLQFPGSLREDEVRALAACPHLAGLTHLDLEHAGLTAAGASILASSPYLAGLTALNLQDNDRLGDDGVTALVASPHLTRLTYLNLRRTHLTDAGLASLARSPLASRLRVLDVGHTLVGDEGLRTLAASPHLGKLTTLNLEGAGGPITLVGLLALAESPYLRCLTYLGLWSEQFPEGGWQALVEPGRIAWPGLSWEAIRSDNLRREYKGRFGWFDGRENLDWEAPFFSEQVG
jgi:uncharacterized protein (TIGR02996 family)